jgi:hypothetical protein
MRERVANLDQELRLALESGDFELALPLIESYGRCAVEAVRNATTPSEQSEMLRVSMEFLQDRLHLARVMRAQIASRIAICTRVGLYQELSETSKTWQLEA